MTGVSRWVGETTDCGLRTAKCDCCDVRTATSNEEEITLEIKMPQEVFKKEWPPAFQCICLCKGLELCELIWGWGWGVVCQAVGFNTFYSTRKHLVLKWKHSKAFFLGTSMSGAPKAWGLAVIGPFWCLSCPEHNFIANIREIASVSALQLLMSEIMIWNKQRRRKNRPECIFITLHPVFPLTTL